MKRRNSIKTQSPGSAIKLNSEKIRSRLKHVLEKLGYGEGSSPEDIAFHMTDWTEDLERWIGFCLEPNRFESKEIEQILTQFLLHAPNHLAAASKLALNVPITDIFGVGAIREDDG